MCLPQRVAQISTKASELYQKAKRGECTARDVAIAVELNQQYIDYLDELEVAQIDCSVTIEIDGEKARFLDTNSFGEFLAEASNE